MRPINDRERIAGDAPIDLLIDYQCHQCGAPVELKETDRIFTCAYCRVKSCLIPGGVFRYVIPHAVADGKDIVFFPYWRYRGILYSCIESEIQHQFVDVTHQAVESPHFPVTMGLRAQAMRLAFVSPNTPGRFLAPALSLQDILKRQEARFKSETAGRKVHLQSHVGDVLSLIYSPFYIDKQVIDAVLNRPVSGILPASFMNTLQQSGLPELQMRFLSAICPSCGWDLSGERNALVLACTNCNSAWQPVGDSLKPVPVGFLSDEDADLFLPFWRIKADVSGIPLSSYADLVHLANLPKVVQPGWDQVEFRFWSPAFRPGPRDFLSLSVRMNLTQPREELKSGNPPGPLYPATLPISEAVDTLKTSLAGMMKPVETGFPQLQQIRIKALRAVLAYIPFRSGHQEWIQPHYSIVINKNMLSLTDH